MSEQSLDIELLFILDVTAFDLSPFMCGVPQAPPRVDDKSVMLLDASAHFRVSEVGLSGDVVVARSLDAHVLWILESLVKFVAVAEVALSFNSGLVCLQVRAEELVCRSGSRRILCRLFVREVSLLVLSFSERKLSSLVPLNDDVRVLTVLFLSFCSVSTFIALIST